MNTENSEGNNPEVSYEELTKTLEEFRQYRERLVNDTMNTAKRAKLKKNQAEAILEPQLIQIDKAIENIRSQLAAFTTGN